MISRAPPRESLQSCLIPEDKGFWLDGTDYNDCIQQLKEWGSENSHRTARFAK